MAGIGFELKRIFKERSVWNLLKGVVYSTFTIIGPMLMIIVGFLALNIIMQYQSVPYDERDLFVSIVLYVFIFSLIVSSPFAAVISRFVADKIFEEQPEHIMPCYYMGLLINMIFGSALCFPFAILTVVRGGADPLLIFAGCCMYMALLLVFYTLTFVSALKEYKNIAVTFLVGVVIIVALSVFMHKILGIGYAMSVITSSAVGFTVIGLVLFALVKRFFRTSSNQYREFLSYFKRHYMLFLTNLFYILGLYIHNFVFWYNTDYTIVVATTMVSAPVYDTATFLAMMTSISATVIFTVRVETNFHDRYQVYCQELIGGIGDDIERAERNMFETLVKELIYIGQMQLIVTLAMFIAIMMFGPSFGFGGILLNIYPALAAGYFVVYIMYAMIIFLYYFDDGKGAFFAALVFFVVTFAASVFARRLIPEFHGIGPFAGAFASWTVSYFRLRHIQRNIASYMYCRGELVKRVSMPKKQADATQSGRVLVIERKLPDNSTPTEPPAPRT